MPMKITNFIQFFIVYLTLQKYSNDNQSFYNKICKAYFTIKIDKDFFYINNTNN